MERKTLVENCYILCGCHKSKEDNRDICERHAIVLKFFISDLYSWELLNEFFNLLMKEPNDKYNRTILNVLGLYADYSGIAKVIGENPYLLRILGK